MIYFSQCLLAPKDNYVISTSRAWRRAKSPSDGQLRVETPLLTDCVTRTALQILMRSYRDEVQLFNITNMPLFCAQTPAKACVPL